METIFLIGVGIFSLSAGYFSVFEKKVFNTAFLVSALMAASYIVMYSDILTFVNSDGNAIYWSRWVVYALSCSLLMYVITKKLAFSAEKIASTISLNVFVMLTGAAAAVLTDWSMIGLFALSGFAYTLMVKPILTDEKASFATKSIIIGGWGLFPVIFLLSHAGFGVIENTLAASVYLALDVLTKIVFYFVDKE